MSKPGGPESQEKKKPRELSTFHKRVIVLVKKIPKGKVVTYGQVAAMAGSPRGARQVVRTLHSASDKEKLPWHRVINREGRISLARGAGYEYQRALLIDEGVIFDRKDIIDLDEYGWKG